MLELAVADHLVEALMTVHDEQPRLKHISAVRLALPWLIVIVFAGIGFRSVAPPEPVMTETAADQFSTERAMAHVQVIAAEPHPMGTEANAAVRAYIIDTLETLGLDVELHTVSARDYFGDRGLVPVVNVIARIPGTADTGAVAFMAHYDTVPATVGANDNTTAVATLLETGRALVAGNPLQNDVLLLFTDGEEPAPQFGSTAFVEQHRAFGDIGLVVNLEASGGSGASVLVETSGSEEWLIEQLAIGDSHPAAFSFLTDLSRRLGEIGTDFDAFRNAGVPGFHFAYLHGSPIYHTDADNIDSVGWGSLQHHGNHALTIARQFGTIDLSDPPPEGNAVFFTIRPFFFQYGSGWVIPLALVGLGVFLGVVMFRSRRSSGISPSLLRDTVAVVGIGLAATTIGTAGWLAVVAVRPTPGVLEAYFYLLVILTVLTFGTVRFMARKQRPGDTRIAIVLLWVIVAVLIAVTLPGFSYLFLWPALVASIALGWNPRRHALSHIARFALVVAPALVLTVPAVDIFFQLAQPRPGNPDSSMPEAAAVPILLALAVIGLVRTFWPERGAPNHPDT